MLQLKQEILEVFRQLQRLQLEVEGRLDEWSPESVDMADLQAGQLLTTLADLRALVHRRLRLSTTSPQPVRCIDTVAATTTTTRTTTTTTVTMTTTTTTKQKQHVLRGLLCRWPSITEWEMYITAQGCRL